MKKTLQRSNVMALIVTIIINYLSNTGIFNGKTMATVSASYQNLFTPAGYAFAIWGLIYLGLAAFVIHQSRGLLSSSEVPAIVGRIGWSYVASCAANCFWVLAWLYEYTGTSVLIMIILLANLILIVKRTRMELDLITLKQIALEWWPFAIYLGWICVALIANVAAYLTKIQWAGFGISQVSWTIVMIFIAMVVNLFLTWNRNMRESASVGVWALIAVGVANKGEEQAVVYASLAASAILLLSTAVHGYRNRGNHFIVGNKTF
ncbi:hypothetical protein DYBT9275_02849 [Dyadobacter sp. CECT 9275]|uniref:Tryptophan-rich sensory protein n=1 Tax=Dyadobacter helix TaxID=2822344 RepID=A0A916JCY0_9BACT|nr:tryptophan-rich sensory protein [Dyadobacter sp. CECT 9275]CAG5002245.1 hypothetical protein DYBT9275_02849 [Dyadobacter sp. CECT 9275]